VNRSNRNLIWPLFKVLILLIGVGGSAWFSVSAQTKGNQQVNNVRLWHSPDKTRIVFDVSEDVRYAVFTLKKPLRFVVDIENADLSIDLPVMRPDNQHVYAIRSGQPEAGLLRFVFELKKPLKNRSFVLSPNELYGHRLVVDLIDPSGAPELVPVAVPESPIITPSIADTDRTRSPSTVIAPPPNPLLIAIDAGHGGEDPGAIGYRGSHEKKITLSIAKQLKQIVDSDPGMRSYMVRKGDYYIKLNKRRQMAHAVNADMFISIHADAFKKRSARGFSVFALSQRGATSAMARALAAKENASDLIGGVSLADKDEVLAKVLVDLSMTNTISESVNLGGRVLRELGKLGKLHSSRVEQAGFAVLKSADIPSILVETGFVTNPDEERKLRSSKYQKKIAKALYSAINDYYQQTPYYSKASYASPSVATRQTSVAKPSGNQVNYHTVVRGDTLSTIAQRYGVSLKELKNTNKLRRNTAVLGARLKLPANAKTTSDSSTSFTTYVVRSGDSLSEISARYNITIRALKRLNGLRSNTVYVGQKIKLPGGAQNVRVKPVKYKVRRGDTLSEIAQRYGASVAEIVRVNKLRSKTILLGQILTIPK